MVGRWVGRCTLYRLLPRQSDFIENDSIAIDNWLLTIVNEIRPCQIENFTGSR